MKKIPNFEFNLRWRRNIIFEEGRGKVSLPEATLLAIPEVLKTAFILHPESREEVVRRARLIDQSPMKLKEVARKFVGEREVQHS